MRDLAPPSLAEVMLEFRFGRYLFSDRGQRSPKGNLTPGGRVSIAVGKEKQRCYLFLLVAA